MMNIYKQKLEYDLSEEKKKYDMASEEYQEEYAIVLNEAVQDFQDKIHRFQEEEILKQNALALLKQQLAVEAATVTAAVEENKRAAEMESNESFYRLNLTDEDLIEIEELRKCTKHLRNPEPLNKVIWKVYYEKATTDLIGRVVGSGVHCGIYKITNLNNGMCYVGQAVKLAGEKLFSATTEGLRIFNFLENIWLIITKPQANEEGNNFSNLVGNFV